MRKKFIIENKSNAMKSRKLTAWYHVRYLPTIDCFTWMGCVKLGHSDQAVVDADYTRIHVIAVTGALFQSDDTDADGVTDGGSAPTEASVEEPANSPSRAVVVVDPFSTGAMVAAYANRANLPW